jgi:hypothetical protein
MDERVLITIKRIFGTNYECHDADNIGRGVSTLQVEVPPIPATIPTAEIAHYIDEWLMDHYEGWLRTTLPAKILSSQEWNERVENYE